MVIDSLVVQESKDGKGVIIHDTSTGQGVVVPIKHCRMVARRITTTIDRIDPGQKYP